MSSSTPEGRSGAAPPPVAEIAAAMSSFTAHWALCGGWAVDAWLDRASRTHADVDISVFRNDQRALFDYLSPDWQLVAHDPNVPDATTDSWTGRQLHLPAHVHARRSGTGLPLGEALHPAEDGFGLDIQIGDLDGDQWLISREFGIAVPAGDCVRLSPWGIPTVVPEVLLAFKALEGRFLDDLDFLTLLPQLTLEQRRRLRTAILKMGAAHPWLEELAPDT